MLRTESSILNEIHRSGYVLDREDLEQEIAWAEDDVRRSLREIISRAEKILDGLDGEHAGFTMSRIADSAGCSGPIGSLWEKCIAKSMKIEVLTRVAVWKRKTSD
jgi:hypothetical protein